MKYRFFFILLLALSINACQSDSKAPEAVADTAETTPEPEAPKPNIATNQQLAELPTKAAPGEINGKFVYFADAPVFRVCGASAPLPVDMSGDYLALEKAYTSADGLEPMSFAFAKVTGYVEQAPKMEGSGTVATLFITKLEAFDKDGECE